jgi:hypothetical protein
VRKIARIGADIAGQARAAFGTVLGGDLADTSAGHGSSGRRLGVFFAAVYFVQGIGEPGAGIASQPIFFLLKDELHLSAAQTAAFLATISIAWGIDRCMVFSSDFFPLFGYRRKSYLLLMTEPRRRLLAGRSGSASTRTSRSWSRCSSVASGSRSQTSCATPSWWKPESPWA